MPNIYSILASLAMGRRAGAESKPTANEFEPPPGGGRRWTAEADEKSECLVSPPPKIPAFSRLLLGFAEREFRKRVLPGRVLTWSTELGIASGALELFIEKGARKILEPRMVYIIRMQVSFAASCPYAIDVNSWTYKDHAITGAEIRAMRGEIPIDEAATFSDREKAALKYARAMSETPPRFGEALLTDLRRLFSHDEIIAVAALAAKVNFWARFIESQRIKPAGYTDDPLLGLEEYRTWEGGTGQ